jgi:ketosteroid isomerase-like protein
MIPFKKQTMVINSTPRCILYTGALLLLSFSAISQTGSTGSSGLVEEIRNVEKQFERDLNSKGVSFAFEKYAAPDAVIKRENDTLIHGSKAIGQYYSTDFFKGAKAFWTPDYISVSTDGTMAYTYGKYRWTFPARTGEVGEAHGIFHTVWKRQPDGTWKYVWD